MKINQTLVAVVGVMAMAASSFAATAPAAPANPSNTQMTAAQADKCAQIMMQYMQKDTRQDARGQAKLDRAWIAYNKAQGINNPGPDPISYEGTPRDMMQDSRLNTKMQAALAKQHCPPVSPIS